MEHPVSPVVSSVPQAEAFRRFKRSKRPQKSAGLPPPSRLAYVKLTARWPNNNPMNRSAKLSEFPAAFALGMEEAVWRDAPHRNRNQMARHAAKPGNGSSCSRGYWERAAAVSGREAARGATFSWQRICFVTSAHRIASQALQSSSLPR